MGLQIQIDQEPQIRVLSILFIHSFLYRRIILKICQVRGLVPTREGY